MHCQREWEIDADLCGEMQTSLNFQMRLLTL